MKVLKKNLKHVQKQQARFYDKRHTFKEFKIENYVWLNDKNIKIKKNKKLKWKSFEFFKIIKIINLENNFQVYKFKLSKIWKIHDVFHVSLLKKTQFNKKKLKLNIRSERYFYWKKWNFERIL